MKKSFYEIVIHDIQIGNGCCNVYATEAKKIIYICRAENKNGTWFPKFLGVMAVRTVQLK